MTRVGFGTGDSPPRREDLRFLRGLGRYVSDNAIPGELHACFLRSPHAHARIVSVRTSAAHVVPGVKAVLTGNDALADGITPLACDWQVVSKNGEPMRASPRPILADSRVRYVGEAVAVVIAESLQQARDGIAEIEVDYEELEPTIELENARIGTQLHDGAPANVCYEWALGDELGVANAVESAAHVTTIDLINNRLIPNALEPRAAIAIYDAAAEQFTLYVTSQNPHMARLFIVRFLGLTTENRLRVISPDVGGGFGSKIPVYAEECVCLWASRRIGRPVRWTAERSESFLADTHGRDHRTVASLALDVNGRFTGLKVKTTANLGAYLSNFGSFVPSFLYATNLTGPYRTPAIYCEVDALYTNTAPVDAYRGAGRPEATYLLETLIDEAARETGRDPIALRRINLIEASDFPYQTPMALLYDTGDFAGHLGAALELSEFSRFAYRRKEAESRGKLRGIGCSCYVEACGIAPSQVVSTLGAGIGLWESASLRFSVTGKLEAVTGSHSHGQGHETVFAQLLSEKFGIPFDDIVILHGDTAQTPIGTGTYGSRSLAVGGSALLMAADKIISKGVQIAAHKLEANCGDIEFRDGEFGIAGTDRCISLVEVAREAYVLSDYPEGLEPGLDETAFYDPQNFTYPSGTYIAEIEIDPETGQIEIVRLTVVDDFGTIVNPQIVHGQVHGGIAQGVGQALFESAEYDPNTGQLLTGSLQDYCLPKASMFPEFRVATTETPCTHTPTGAKGCGEAGAIGVPPAIMNAVANALGVRVSMPASAEKVWRAVSGHATADD